MNLRERLSPSRNRAKEVWSLPQEPELFFDTVITGGSIKALQRVLELASHPGTEPKIALAVPTDAVITEPPILTENFIDYSDFNDKINKLIDKLHKTDNITLLPNTDLRQGADSSKLSLRSRAVYVDRGKCDNCGECSRSCPVKLVDFGSGTEGLADRAAIGQGGVALSAETYAIQRLKVPYCQASCPISMDIRGYIGAIADGDITQANEVMARTNPLPLTCGKICTHACEGTCARGYMDEPVQVRNLKRYAAEFKSDSAKGTARNTDAANKVAVIGSGPAGIAAANDLAQWGYPVTIFEAHAKSGGMLRVGIPDFRLAPETVDQELSGILELEGLELKLESHVGDKHSFEDLTAQLDYKAILIAVGTHESLKLRIEGEESEGVVPGMEFLRELNLTGSAKVGKKVAVIGGGNVVVDAARAAKRLGAEKVTILYRRSRAEMPAYKEELEQALAEGIELEVLTAPAKVVSDESGHVNAIECIRMELGEPDSSGRRRPVPIEGSEFTFESDTIIPAIGQGTNLKFLGDGTSGLNLRPNGTFVIDEYTGATNVSGIFAGGDAVTGPDSVITAIRAGKRAAVGIDAYLRGVEPAKEDTGWLEGEFYYQGELSPTELRMAKLHKSIYKFSSEDRHGRYDAGELEANVRVSNFEEVELGLDENNAKAEAERCLACRLCIGCGICAAVCPRDAIDYTQQDTDLELAAEDVQRYPSAAETSVPPSLYDIYKSSYNVITAAELEAMLNPSGAYGGTVMRPSEGDVPRAVAFVYLDPGAGGSSQEYAALSLVHLVKLANYLQSHTKNITIKFFTDTAEPGALPENYSYLGDAKEVLAQLGDALVNVPDLEIDFESVQSKIKLSATSSESDVISFEVDLVVIASCFDEI
jgi:NADPH-dependent glutamate synthase beta subunit-like oxidoreductase